MTLYESLNLRIGEIVSGSAIADHLVVFSHDNKAVVLRYPSGDFVIVMHDANPFIRLPQKA